MAASADGVRRTWDGGIVRLRRFAREGRVEPPNEGRADGAAAILYVPRHKNGLPYRVAVSQEVARAAQLVLDAGTFDPRWFAKVVTAACKAARVPTITSRLMRNTVLSHAVSKGVTTQRAGEFAGHSDVKTTRITARSRRRRCRRWREG
jgi:integrase